MSGDNEPQTVVEQARMQVAGLLNASDLHHLTSLWQWRHNLSNYGCYLRSYSTPQHLIISSVEHSAVAEPARLLKQWVGMLPTCWDAKGWVNPLTFRRHYGLTRF